MQDWPCRRLQAFILDGSIFCWYVPSPMIIVVDINARTYWMAPNITGLLSTNVRMAIRLEASIQHGTVHE